MLVYIFHSASSEIRNIKCSNINLETGVLYIEESKMHKDRTIVVTPDLLHLCNRYNLLMSSIYNDRKYFFQDPNGKPYTAGWIQEQFWRCWNIAGINAFHGSHPRVYDFRYPNLNKIQTFFKNA